MPHSGYPSYTSMLISGKSNLSQLRTCLDAAHNFLIDPKQAQNIFEDQIRIIDKHWDAVCDEAELSVVDRNLLWKRQFLNSWSIDVNS
jgi:serine/threonine-protein kinase HipA